MRLLVIGCGSIGQRHARNASTVADTHVVDLEPARAAAVARETGATAHADLERALASDPDGVIVATPHTSHVPIAMQAVQAGAHVLIEKPISHDMVGIDELLDVATSRDVEIRVACNMRFHPGVAALRDALPRIGKPLFARAHFGNHLPDMRPGVDYRQLYAAARAEGGGLLLDAIHEFDYLTWLLGPARRVTALGGTQGALDIDVDDTVHVSMDHETGTRSHIHLDYLRRGKSRGCEIIGSEATVVWQSNGKQPENIRVELVRGESRTPLVDMNGYDTNAPYVAQLDRFMALLRGRSDDLATGREGQEALKTVLAATQAANETRMEDI